MPTGAPAARALRPRPTRVRERARREGATGLRRDIERQGNANRRERAVADGPGRVVPARGADQPLCLGWAHHRRIAQPHAGRRSHANDCAPQRNDCGLDRCRQQAERPAPAYSCGVQVLRETVCSSSKVPAIPARRTRRTEWTLPTKSKKQLSTGAPSSCSRRSSVTATASCSTGNSQQAPDTRTGNCGKWPPTLLQMTVLDFNPSQPGTLPGEAKRRNP
jgi:hypothetical protein